MTDEQGPQEHMMSARETALKVVAEELDRQATSITIEATEDSYRVLATYKGGDQRLTVCRAWPWAKSEG